MSRLERGGVTVDGLDDEERPRESAFLSDTEAAIERARRSAPLAADGSVTKHRWLSLSRLSGHGAGRPIREQLANRGLWH